MRYTCYEFRWQISFFIYSILTLGLFFIEIKPNLMLRQALKEKVLQQATNLSHVKKYANAIEVKTLSNELERKQAATSLPDLFELFKKQHLNLQIATYQGQTVMPLGVAEEMHLVITGSLHDIVRWLQALTQLDNFLIVTDFNLQTKTNDLLAMDFKILLLNLGYKHVAVNNTKYTYLIPFCGFKAITHFASKEDIKHFANNEWQKVGYLRINNQEWKLAKLPNERVIVIPQAKI